MLTQDEAFARIRLLRSPDIGPAAYRELLRRFATAAAAIEALPGLARRGGGGYEVAPVREVEREITATARTGARYLFHDSPEYPELLGLLDNAPPILTVRGSLALAAGPCVAMVGARNASVAAMRIARDFSRKLAQRGFVVVSGLARGIDGAAHEGALAGEGGTIGVIASGIDIAYPAQHAALQERIASEGLLIAEQPAGTRPRGSQFPSRNRIIAGFSLGTVVVEAAPRSGSLITARLAAQAGREVMAVPGSPLEPRSLGCNELIREGAVLVQSPDDIVELLQGFEGGSRSTFREVSREPQAQLPMVIGEGAGEAAGDGSTAERPHASSDLAALLTAVPVGVDELIRQSGQSAGAVQMALLELEISGRLVRHAGGRVSLA